MKKTPKDILMYFSLVTLAALCGAMVGLLFTPPGITQDTDQSSPPIKQEVIEKPKTVEEALKDLGPEDPRKAKVDFITWQIKYYQEHMRALQLEYTARCYQDTRYKAAMLEIVRLNREMRRLLIP